MQNEQTIEPLTGIESVDQFLADLPTKFWEPREPNGLSRPHAVGFTADGKIDVLSPAVPSGVDVEDSMDAAANLFVAYAKTANPIAMVMVSEGFHWHEEPGERKYVDPSDTTRRMRVDEKRFISDARYRREIEAAGRREVLFAFVQTAGKQWSVQWRIHRGRREGRWLGQREVMGGTEDCKRHGRFANLLRKAHAGDEMVETSPSPRNGFNPRPMAEQQARLPAALLPVVDPEQWTDQMMADRTFDFENQLSLFFIGIFDGDGESEEVGVMAFNQAPPMPMSEFRAKVMATLAELRGHPIEEVEVRGKLMARSMGTVAFRLDWSGGVTWRRDQPCNA
jgi:hypothetical protein